MPSKNEYHLFEWREVVVVLPEAGLRLLSEGSRVYRLLLLWEACYHQ